jgi:hypothetical protein
MFIIERKHVCHAHLQDASDLLHAKVKWTVLGGFMFVLECWYNFLVQLHYEDWQWNQQGDLGHRLGSQFVLKNLSYYALVEGQQSWRLLLSTVILIVTSSKPTILYESSILSSPPTVDITLILFHVVSRACIVRWNVHAPHRVSPLTLDITLILVHGVSVACLMRMYISSIKTFPPYFRHYIDFVHVVFSCLLFHKLPVRLFEMRYTWIWEDH